MEMLYDIGGFAGKVLLVTMALVVILVVLANLLLRSRAASQRHLEVESVNDRFQAYADALHEMSSDPKQMKKELKARAKAEKQKRKEGVAQPKVFVLNFDGDVKASAVEQLRDEITAVLTSAQNGDEVVVKVESTGGMVHTYGLAATQLLRIRAKGLKLTICVDKVAASGGYMMACTADQLLAAPFAILGSIGVVAQVPNLHRVLKKHDVDYEEMTAGEYKRTISILGEITEKGRQKFLSQLEDTHTLFKNFVAEYRPQLNLSQIATGEYWYGKQALELKLCDRLQSSDDYLFSLHPERQILELSLHHRKTLGEKLAENISVLFERGLLTWRQKLHDDSILR
ncbi:MAG: protease SohB [Bdellovibrionales bacterium]